MASNILEFHRGANAPVLYLTCVDAAGEPVDWSGQVAEVQIRPKRAAEPIVLRSDGEGPALTITETPGRIALAYDEAFLGDLYTGRHGRADVYRVDGSAREWVSGCIVEVFRAGEGSLQTEMTAFVPGLQGPPPWTHRGAWEAGTYPAKSSVSHDGSTWLTLVETDEEPGDGAHWELLLDGAGAAADRAAAEAAAATATGAAATATTKAGEADADATQVAADKATVAADKGTVQTIYNAITAAPKTISAGTYTLELDDLGKVLRFTNACVVTLPADFPAGWYCTRRRVGAGAVTWVAASGATKHEYPAGSGIAAQWSSVVDSVDSNADGHSAVWLVEGSIL